MKIITRKLYADKVDAWVGKGQIILLVGQRRVGKSNILKDFLERHKSESRANFIYINKERKQFDAINIFYYFKNIDICQIVKDYRKMLKGRNSRLTHLLGTTSDVVKIS